MNLLLIEPDEIANGRVALRGRRADHLRRVRGIAPGDRLAAGVLDGGLGEATVLEITPDSISIELTIEREPPPALPLTLVLALPRPKVMRRVLQGIAAIGLKRVVLIGSWRVEKSYWESPYLQPQALREQLVLGLEQGGDTRLPCVELYRRFKPFVEDELPSIAGDSACFVAHPVAALDCPRGQTGHLVLAVGPDAGFSDYEVQRLRESGFTAVTLGPRLLRVEQAIPALIGRLL